MEPATEERQRPPAFSYTHLDNDAPPRHIPAATRLFATFGERRASSPHSGSTTPQQHSPTKVSTATRLLAAFGQHDLVRIAVADEEAGRRADARRRARGRDGREPLVRHRPPGEDDAAAQRARRAQRRREAQLLRDGQMLPRTATHRPRGCVCDAVKGIGGSGGYCDGGELSLVSAHGDEGGRSIVCQRRASSCTSLARTREL